jgi:uncharacterized membrane protein
MNVLLIFLGATAVALVVAVALRRPLRRALPLALRAGLATMFLVTGVTHFVVLRTDLVAMVPPALPSPELLVSVTGVLEVLGAVGLLHRRTAAWAAAGLAILLVVMFPANVYAAMQGLMLGGEPATQLVPRAAMQLLYLAAALIVARTHRREALRPQALRRQTTAQEPAPSSADARASR